MLFKILFGISVLIIVGLVIYIFELRKAFDEIKDQVDMRVKGETNSPITLSTNDRKARDTTEFINDEIRILNKERMKYTNGNRDIDNAIANISHDLRTPLTAMNSYIDLLMKEKDETVRQEYLKRLKNRTDIMTELTKELFNYSAAVSETNAIVDTNLTSDTCDITAVLQDCILSFYNAFIEKGITPNINIPDETINVCIETTTAYRILENIIGNGIKYAEKNFDIDMSDKGVIKFSNYAPDLTQIDVAQLFDRFYTVKNSTASTGIGLSIAKELLHTYGGDVTAELTQNKIFSITVTFKY